MSLKERVINIAPDFVVKFCAAPYVAGDNKESAIQEADCLWQSRRILSTLDILGEELTSKEEVEKVVASYFGVLNGLKGRNYATISLKPTQLGIHQSFDYCYHNISRILDKAAEYKNFATIDMEDSSFTDVTLSLFKKLRQKYENVGTVLQSRLFRTEKDIEQLDGFQAHIRLCIGIYREPPEIALQNKKDMKEKLLIYMERLFEKGHYVAIATHDERLIHRCMELLQKKEVPPEQHEFQMLAGVPRAKIQDELIQKGHTMRVYIPFAEDWKDAIAYCKRRLIANRSMGFYVARNWCKKLVGKR